MSSCKGMILSVVIVGAMLASACGTVSVQADRRVTEKARVCAGQKCGCIGTSGACETGSSSNEPASDGTQPPRKDLTQKPPEKVPVPAEAQAPTPLDPDSIDTSDCGTVDHILPDIDITELLSDLGVVPLQAGMINHSELEVEKYAACVRWVDNQGYAGDQCYAKLTLTLTLTLKEQLEAAPGPESKYQLISPPGDVEQKK